MNTLLITLTLLFGTDDAPKKPFSARPAALVLKVKGAVFAGQRRVEPGDLLLPGEVLSAPADAEALLVFLVKGERGRLKAGGRTTLTRDGCDPADAVEMLGAAKLSRKNLTKVREIEVREGGGAGGGQREGRTIAALQGFEGQGLGPVPGAAGAEGAAVCRG